MATRAEAEQDQREALADLVEDGTLAVLRWPGGDGAVDPATGMLPESTPVDVQLPVLVTAYSVRDQVNGSIKPSDVRVMLSELSVAGKFPSGALSRTPAPTGFFLYLANPPAAGSDPVYPDPDDSTTWYRQYRVVALENTVFEGARPLLHFLRASA